MKQIVRKIAGIQVILMLSSVFVFGQAYQIHTKRIDSLADAGLPKSALKEVDKLELLARKGNRHSDIIRTAIYRIKLLQYMEESAIVNIIKALREDVQKSEFPVRPVLQSLLAEMYWKYYTENKWQFMQRSRLEKPDPDINRWDLKTIVKECSRLYALSLRDTTTLQKTPVSIIENALTGDTATRHLRPTLYDLLVHRALNFYLNEEPALPEPRLPFTLRDRRLFDNAGLFVRLNIQTSDTTSTYFKGIRYLQQASRFHLNEVHREVLADIDLRRLKFLYNNSPLPDKDSLYQNALLRTANDISDKPLGTDALVLAGQYYQEKDSLRTAHDLFKKASASFPGSPGAENALKLLAQLETPEIQVTAEETNVPGRPFPALLEYRNIDQVKIQIYKLTSTQFDRYTRSFGTAFGIYQNDTRFHVASSAVLDVLSKCSKVQEFTLNLPGQEDYRMHSAEFKVDSLKPGIYVLLAGRSEVQDTSFTQLLDFRISRLAFVNRKNPDSRVEIQVTDRESGAPLPDVGVLLYRHDYEKKSKPLPSGYIHKGITDKNGRLKTSQLSVSSFDLQLNFGTDTLTEKQGGWLRSREVDKKLKEKTILFTDRQIYRPGQTIHFKGIELRNLNDKTDIIPEKKTTVTFKDGSNKEISSLLLTSNEYGSFSGEFVVPQHILNGDISIRTPDGSITVKVEEYKRPSFNIEFLPVKGSFRLNDTVIIRGRVKAFSGYGLSQARLVYRITRTLDFDHDAATAIYGSSGRYIYSNPLEIETDTVFTDNQGNYSIPFKAIADEKIKGEAFFRYQISADVTDATGETHSATGDVIVGSRSYRLSAAFPSILFSGDTAKLHVDLTTPNGEKLKGTINTEIYSLQQPTHLLKQKLWSIPDQQLMDREEYKRLFPEYPWKNEDNPAQWLQKEKVLHTESLSDTSAATVITLPGMTGKSSGTYKMIVKARTTTGDTASSILYFKYLNNQSPHTIYTDAIIPVITAAEPGQEAEFLVGNASHTFILMEVLDKTEIISSKWIDVQTQEKIRIPFFNAKNLTVQFLSVFQNRLYTSSHRIFVKSPEKALNIKLLTFREQLETGQKEQWKLQITNYKNQGKAAELLAGMYDASLDNIAYPQNWSIPSSDSFSNAFSWNSFRFVNNTISSPLSFTYKDYALSFRNYENIDLLGYSYFGGYNEGFEEYRQFLRDREKMRERDKRLEEEYVKNAAFIKQGNIIKGLILDASDNHPLAGVSVSIKDSKISTVSNSKGEFKMKVPVGGIIVISSTGYFKLQRKLTSPGKLKLLLKSKDETQREAVITGQSKHRKSTITGAISTFRIRGMGMTQPTIVQDNTVHNFASLEISDPGVKSIEGDPNAEMRLDEPTVPASKAGQVPAIKLRKNFNETAFFYPQLRTDEKGEVAIGFTTPEAMTRWKFRALAHTREFAYGYIEQDVITQKQLMVGANMPRFFREGDTISISARVANLTSHNVTANIGLSLFNAVTMRPISLLADPGQEKQSLIVKARTNEAVSFKLAIPSDLEALTYRLTASTESHSDGEENTVPVLSDRMLVNESLPMMVRPGQTSVFRLDKLLNNNSSTLVSKSITLEYTENPVWYAVQAMPYLIEFPYDCSEQTFSRYFANSLSASIIQSLPAIAQTFKQWKASGSKALQSNLEKNPELKNLLLEESPWLRNAASESEQKKRIALLFDLNKLSHEQIQTIDKLSKMQLADGGFPWFSGSRSDRYISQHILAGIGQLYQLKAATGNDVKLKNIKRKLLAYLDTRIEESQLQTTRNNKNSNSDPLSSIEIHAWYTRSFFNDVALNNKLRGISKLYLAKAEKDWTSEDIYEQAMIALTMLHYDRPQVAQKIIRSLKERAQHSQEMGMYWTQNRSGRFWSQSTVETQSLLISLFTEAGGHEKAVQEMKIWLLRNKQTNNWQTTKATAAACHALLLQGDTILSRTSGTTIRINNESLANLKPDIQRESGSGYIKTNWTGSEIKPEIGNIKVTNNGNVVSWGALHWQYTEKMNKITPSSSSMSIERKYFVVKKEKTGEVLSPVDALHTPKTGDLLRVVIYLKADQDYEYIHLKDMRPSGTDPVDVLSSFKYQDGLPYYQVTRDVATNFFIDHLNKGSYVFEYSLRVAQPGNYSTGICSIQCMYAPEFNAHSEGRRMITER
ncbi:alpha-2-macroglobulin family protein [Pararcticibacter amylolyticus]|nr:alpha-2-macroglobulin family protein [Pararcticibacter amylolyticus]